MPIALLFPLLCAVCPVAFGLAPKPVTIPITGADTVLAVYAQDSGLSCREPQLILAIWGDGRAIWSDDPLGGGFPYRSGKIDPKRVISFFSGLERDGFFADQGLNQTHFGPDSRFTTILAKSGKKELKMQSWHELYKAPGKIVATKTGLTPLAGRSRLAVLAREPADYLYYRLAWSELRERASTLIPSQSKPVVGNLIVDGGVFSWGEVQDKP